MIRVLLRIPRSEPSFARPQPPARRVRGTRPRTRPPSPRSAAPRRSPSPCHVTPPRPRIAHDVGSDSATSRTQPGSRNDGTHSPPTIEMPRMTRMLTLRARASVPPIAATSNPVAAASPHAATASSTKPRNEPVIVTPNDEVAEAERDQHLQERDARRSKAPSRSARIRAAPVRPASAPTRRAAVRAGTDEPALHAPEQQVLQRHPAEAVRVRVELTVGAAEPADEAAISERCGQGMLVRSRAARRTSRAPVASSRLP